MYFRVVSLIDLLDIMVESFKVLYYMNQCHVTDLIVLVLYVEELYKFRKTIVNTVYYCIVSHNMESLIY